MKKFYQISNLPIFGKTKQELKADRNRLNREALGDKFDPKNANAWPYRITKGPEHPHLG